MHIKEMTIRDKGDLNRCFIARGSPMSSKSIRRFSASLVGREIEMKTKRQAFCMPAKMSRRV